MNIGNISSKYEVKKLTENDIDDIYELSCGNPLYYRYCPPYITRDSILEDMRALPPNKTYDDKYYIGFWENDRLIAQMDLILNYPNNDTVFIGLFMLKKDHQGCGIGSDIMNEFFQYAKNMGYTFVRLGYAKGNPQSRAFWIKNGFCETGIEYENTGYTVIVLQKSI